MHLVLFLFISPSFVQFNPNYEHNVNRQIRKM